MFDILTYSNRTTFELDIDKTDVMLKVKLFTVEDLEGKDSLTLCSHCLHDLSLFLFSLHSKGQLFSHKSTPKTLEKTSKLNSVHQAVPKLEKKQEKDNENYVGHGKSRENAAAGKEKDKEKHSNRTKTNTKVVSSKSNNVDSKNQSSSNQKDEKIKSQGKTNAMKSKVTVENSDKVIENGVKISDSLTRNEDSVATDDIDSKVKVTQGECVW